MENTDQANPHYPAKIILSLVENYGEEAVRRAADKIIGTLEKTRQIPSEFYKILSPQSLYDTVSYLEASVDDLLEKGRAREAAYGNKGELLQQKTRLETEIKLDEATALMTYVSEDGKKAIFEGKTFPLNNGEQRDAFVKMVSADNRRRLAAVDGEIQSLDIDMFKARDGWETAKEAGESVRRKAYLQAELLNWLAGGR